jgi:hypothetical protein
MMHVRVWPRSAGREVTVELVCEDTYVPTIVLISDFRFSLDTLFVFSCCVNSIFAVKG